MPFRTIGVRSTRFYSAHHALLRIASASLSSAKAKEAGWEDHQFVAIALSALAIEALCNAVGERSVPDWDEYESCSPKAKLRILCTSLGIEYDKTAEPWSSLAWLGALRNKVAHPKAEQVDETVEVIGWEKSKERHRIAPKSALEKQISEGNAERAVQAVKTAKTLFAAALPEEKQVGISSDSWCSSSRILNEGV